MAAGELPASISEPGKVPERFSGPDEVDALANLMLQADQPRACLRADLEKLWGGNPIYTLKQLADAGQTWRARTNYRGLEGIISKENTLDYDLETEGEAIIEVCLDFGEGQKATDWQTIIADTFKWLMHFEWPDFNFHIPLRHLQKNLHGIGAHMWPDITGNWIPRTPKTGEILFPENCPFNFHEDGDYFMLRDFVPAYKLYRWIENEKEARIAGWNPDMAWKALAETNKQTGNNRKWLRPEEWSRQIREGDIGMSQTRQSGLWLNHLFAREFKTSKISQYTVAEGCLQKDYLFKKRNRFDEWPVVLFPYDIGNGNLHGVKGLGERTKEFFEMQNRLNNAMVDQVQLSSYPNMKQTVQNVDPDKMRLTRMGGMNWTPYGVEPSLIQFPDLNRGPLALLGTLQQGMIENNRGGSGGAPVEQRDRMSADEYSMRIQENNRLNNGSVALQRSCLSRFYRKVLDKLTTPTSSTADWAKMAREFRKRCLDQGVPEEAFKHIYEVKAVVAFGKGSSVARTNAYRDLMASPVYASTSEDRRIAIERGFVASQFGYEGVQKFCRSVDDNEIPDGDDSFAVQENNALMAGGEALAAPRQNQIDHLSIHFNKVAELVNAYQQGQAEPQMAYAAIQSFGAHTKQHLDFLAQDPTKKGAYQNFFNQWQALSRIADKLEADIESAAEATPPEQQISDDLRIGMAKVDAKTQVDMYKAEQQSALRARQQAMRERTLNQQLLGNNARANVKLTTEIQRDNVKTGAEILQSTAKTRAATRQ